MTARLRQTPPAEVEPPEQVVEAKPVVPPPPGRNPKPPEPKIAETPPARHHDLGRVATGGKDLPSRLNVAAEANRSRSTSIH